MQHNVDRMPKGKEFFLSPHRHKDGEIVSVGNGLQFKVKHHEWVYSDGTTVVFVTAEDVSNRKAPPTPVRKQ